MSIRPELRRELLTLSPAERQEVADELYESLVDESLDPEWEREWSKEIEERVKDVADNRVELIDADDVHRELHAPRGYTSEDIEAYVRQNSERSGFWSGYRRVFVGFGVTDSDRYRLALTRRLPDRLIDWWTLVLPSDVRLKAERQLEHAEVVVARSALREDSLRDEFSVGDVVTFELWPDTKARRLRVDGPVINAILEFDLDIVAIPSTLHRP